MIAKQAIETAYCFFHQKQRVYQYSTMEWQRDDIEYAISDYVNHMDPELLALLAKDRKNFLQEHDTFGDQLLEAVNTLDVML